MIPVVIFFCALIRYVCVCVYNFECFYVLH